MIKDVFKILGVVVLFFLIVVLVGVTFEGIVEVAKIFIKG